MKKNITFVLIISLIFFVSCSNDNSDELEANKPLADSQIDYNRYAIEEGKEFTSYISDNPIDKKYAIDYANTLEGLDTGYYDMYYLERSYKRLWEIEMEYAYNRIHSLVENDAWAYLTNSQENFNKAIENIDHFTYEAFTKNKVNIGDSTTKAVHYKNLYRNRTIELLEYLYILEDGKKPTFLFEDYSEDIELIESAEQNIKKLSWDELEIVLPIEHRLSKLTPNGIYIFKLHGYKVISKQSNMSKFSVDGIEIYDENYKLMQSIDVSNTLVPSERLFDFGFEIVDWNFDGYPDISLFAFEGGTMLNAPSYYWFWDDSRSIYVLNEELTKLSDSSYLGVNIENEEVMSTYRNQGHHSTYYSWIDGELTPKRYEGTVWEKEEGNNSSAYLVKKVFDNGEWIEVERTPFGIND